MEFKPFAIHVGYDSRVTEYEQGKRGKGPTAGVMNWLAEAGIRWQFDWIDSHSEEEKIKPNGGTFYFDTEEDRLLFCLKWLSQKEESLFWHPV
jgi:hypothetical protein